MLSYFCLADICFSVFKFWTLGSSSCCICWLFSCQVIYCWFFWPLSCMLILCFSCSWSHSLKWLPLWFIWMLFTSAENAENLF